MIPVNQQPLHASQLAELLAKAEQPGKESLRLHPTKLLVVPDATHLFPEPGALVHVSTLARDWFTEHLLKM